MTDAIGAGKFDQAAQVLGELFQMQEPPIKILWSLGRNMRQLYSARLALERGRGASYVADLWGLRSFQAEKIFTAARRFSLPWCRPGGGPVRRGGPGHEVHRPGRAAAAHQPAAGAVRPRPEARPAPAVRGTDMLKIREAIAVEGRYDKNTLSQVVDTLILETHGFGIFKDPERMALLRRAAEKRGLIVLTDSDGAGFVIRNRIKSAIPGQYLKHAYIPDVYGKEKRKRQRGKEGKLGVEGMPPAVLEQVLRRAGATFLDQGEAREQEPPSHQGGPVRRRPHRPPGQRPAAAGPLEAAGTARAYDRQRPAGGAQHLLHPGGGVTFLERKVTKRTLCETAFRRLIFPAVPFKEMMILPILAPKGKERAGEDTRPYGGYRSCPFFRRGRSQTGPTMTDQLSPARPG